MDPRRRARLVTLVVGLFLVGVLFLIPSQLSHDVVYSAIGLAPFALNLVGIRINRPPDRLARTMGLDVVAEGIERPDQLDRPVELGCSKGQDFLMARPLEPQAARALVAGGHPRWPRRPADRTGGRGSVDPRARPARHAAAPAGDRPSTRGDS